MTILDGILLLFLSIKICEALPAFPGAEGWGAGEEG